MSDSTRGPTPERDDVGVLLQLAGKRAPVPDDRARRAREAAHAAWSGEVRRRSRWVWASGAAAALVAAAILLWVVFPGRAARPVSAPPVLAGPPARVEATVGAVRMSVPAGPGDPLPWGTGVETDESGLVSIRLGAGRALRIGSSTRLVLADPGDVELRRGTVYVDSADGAAGNGLSVRTPLGAVTEVGTRFEVRVDDRELRVRLRDGRVEVRSAERNWTVGQGAELRVRPDGTETHGAIPSHGVEWDWTLGVTPVPDFGGEPMSAFLAWVARERGWSIAYADAMTERSADSSILRGSLALLRVDEALEAAMTATGLRYRIDRGTMVVSRTDPERR